MTGANDADAQHKMHLLASALRQCRDTEGRIARRNARKRVLAALRAVRAHLDATYPAIVVRKKGTKQASPETLHRRAKKAGWVAAANDAGLFAAAGVPIKRVPHACGISGGYALYVPGWAVAIGAENQAQLRAAKKSVQLRKAALARAILLQDA